MAIASIDAGVLAVPSEEDNAERIHDYVDTLLDWHKMLGETWISIHVSERASELLVEEGLFPLRDALQRSLQSNGIVEYDVNTVAQVAERLLRLTPSFESHFGVRDVLLERMETRPPLLSLTIGQNMAEDLGRCIVLMAILRRYCDGVGVNHRLIVRGVAGAGRSPCSRHCSRHRTHKSGHGGSADGSSELRRGCQSVPGLSGFPREY